MLYSYEKMLALICVLLISAFTVYSQTDTFTYTGSVQTWTAPECIDYVIVDAMGATGGSGVGYTSPSHVHNIGGNGGRVRCHLTVSPGQTLHIHVGGRGIDAAGTPAPGGYNGGGSVSAGGLGIGGSGGGASDIRISPYSLDERIVVAAGGGGGGGLDCVTPTSPPNQNRGGYGGGTTGGDGWSCGAPGSPYAGYGATPTSGGLGGSAGSPPGGDGSWGLGGDGAYLNSGGGGGGGLYGGGGGIADGGGGGSSFADITYASAITQYADYNADGNGRVILTVVPCDTTVGVNQPSADDFSIYPNPATEQLVITTAGKEQYHTVSIYNSIGQLFLTKSLSNTREVLNISDLPAGVYYICLQNNKTMVYRRFIKK